MKKFFIALCSVLSTAFGTLLFWGPGSMIIAASAPDRRLGGDPVVWAFYVLLTVGLLWGGAGLWNRWMTVAGISSVFLGATSIGNYYNFASSPELSIYAPAFPLFLHLALAQILVGAFLIVKDVRKRRATVASDGALQAEPGRILGGSTPDDLQATTHSQRRSAAVADGRDGATPPATMPALPHTPSAQATREPLTDAEPDRRNLLRQIAQDVINEFDLTLLPDERQKVQQKRIDKLVEAGAESVAIIEMAIEEVAHRGVSETQFRHAALLCDALGRISTPAAINSLRRLASAHPDIHEYRHVATAAMQTLQEIGDISTTKAYLDANAIKLSPSGSACSWDGTVSASWT